MTLEWDRGMRKRLHQCRAILAGGIILARLCPGMLGASEERVSLADRSVDREPPGANPHWAYQLIRQPPIPVVQDQGYALSPVDAFIAEKLESKGLSLSAEADRRTLIRRAYIDLVGLAPGFEEVEKFASDHSPDAFARLVDQLLGSPFYGERWGRHWLDVARFAETKDLVLLFGKDRLLPYAYTYRDYVIQALNLDTPYNQFVQEQIAADLIEPPVDRWRLAALGFLTVGRLFDENPHDQIDDQIDTVTRGFLGLTVACARCHHHKYDAIPTEDYYSLYGVFASSERPHDPPLLEDPGTVPGGLEFERALSQARQALQNHIDAQYDFLSETARERIRDYLLRVATTTRPDLSETSAFFLSLSPEDLRPGLVLRWRRYMQQPAREHDPVFRLWAGLMQLPDDGFAQSARHFLAAACAEPDLNPLVADLFRQAVLTSKADVAHAYGSLFEDVYARFRRPGAAPVPLPSVAECQLLEALEGRESPSYFPKSSTKHHMSRVERDQYGKLERELDKLAAYATNAPPRRAMVVADAEELCDPRVFVRGSPARPGKAVPRQFLEVLAGAGRQPFSRGSGRLELAKAIVAEDNPLTSRVLVNRVWMHHFGEPLVSSPSDFGTRSAPPTHPELLDYLAWSFMADGWSLKQLHRRIMLTRVYQQSSADRPECRAVDPDNRWLWRAHRRRLDWESMRDSMLGAAGRLDATMGGRSVDVAGDPLNGRRTVYGLVDRQDLPAAFRAFDFACPDQSVERRPRTIVPQQALFAMNSPFVLEQARAVAVQVEREPDRCSESRGNGGECAHRVIRLYQRVLGRVPEPGEIRRALEFLAGPAEEEGEGEVPLLAQLAQALLMSNEFMFLD